ncbi:MAG: ATP-binding protein [Sulfurimonadaceae bacterium]|jgi:hypothetical protein|nr:ATP-binding protein [Sulfurimonadaceae bacterium]
MINVREQIGKYMSSIDTLELEERMLYYNTLIVAEEGAGKTNLACRIRNFVIDNKIATLYIDFANSTIEQIEERYKDKYFNYIQFSESEEFDEEFNLLVEDNKNIYMAVDPSYFATKKDVKSKLTQTLQHKGLLDNYYYFFHDIDSLEGFYAKFENFLLYMLGFLNLKKYGLTFLSQPNPIFENPQVKLLFTFLYVGKCTNLHYFNTSVLKVLPKNKFLYQCRMAHATLLFNDIKTSMVLIDEYDAKVE